MLGRFEQYLSICIEYFCKKLAGSIQLSSVLYIHSVSVLLLKNTSGLHQQPVLPGGNYFFINRGFNVYQPNAGKKCMGMASPGKNSGLSNSNGNL